MHAGRLGVMAIKMTEKTEEWYVRALVNILKDAQYESHAEP